MLHLPDRALICSGKMFGFVHLYSGQVLFRPYSRKKLTQRRPSIKASALPLLQEAVSTGVIRLLRQNDYVCSTYRDHVHALSKNVPAREVMAELFGKKTGICRGQGGSMHMFSAKHGLVGLLCKQFTDSTLPPLKQCGGLTDLFLWLSLGLGLAVCPHAARAVQLGGFAFIGEGIPIGLGAAFQAKYRRVSWSRCTCRNPTEPPQTC